MGHYTTRAVAFNRSGLAGLRLSKTAGGWFCGVYFSAITDHSLSGGTIDSPNSKTKGDLTETKVIHELIARGCNVSIPFGDNAKYDLVVEDPTGSLHRIQCKTAWESPVGTIRFNTHSQTTLDGEYHETSYDGAIDAFIVRNPPDEQIFWIDIKEATQRKMDLRYDAAIDHPSINWAPDFELGQEIPPSRG